MKPSSFVYWSRFFIAIATGAGSVILLSGLISGELATSVYAGLAMLVYASTAAFYRYFMHFGEAELRGKNKYITMGIGTFIITWVMTLVLTYTILGAY